MTPDVETIDSQPLDASSTEADKSFPDCENVVKWDVVFPAFIESPKRLVKLFKTKSFDSLRWGQPNDLACWNELQDLEKRFGELDEAAIEAAGIDESEISTVYRALGLVYLFDNQRKKSDKQIFEKFFSDRLGYSVQFTEKPNDCPLFLQLIGVELPLSIALVLGAEQEYLKSICQFALKRFVFAVDSIADGDGWIKADHAQSFWGLCASWARCFAICEKLNLELAESLELQLEWACRQFIRSTGPDGSSLLGRSSTMASPEFQKSVLAMSSDGLDKKLLKHRDFRQKAKDDSNRLLDDDGCFSLWAGTGVFHSHWGTHSPAVGIAVSSEGIELYIVNRKRLLTCTKQPNISINQRPISFDGDEFETNCYHSDEQIDYLDIGFKGDGDIQMHRQIVFVRDDQVLLLIDSILGANADDQVEYEQHFQLGPEQSVLPETETREVYIKGPKINALVIPLSLGEWLEDHGPGGFSVTDDGILRYSKASVGPTLCCATLIDLSPKRSKQPRTWRKLTVGQDQKIVSEKEAVAFRVRIGVDHWVVYRSLTGPEDNRTFLGENQVCDFYIGRFDGECAADEILQIG